MLWTSTKKDAHCSITFKQTWPCVQPSLPCISKKPQEALLELHMKEGRGNETPVLLAEMDRNHWIGSAKRQRALPTVRLLIFLLWQTAVLLVILAENSIFSKGMAVWLISGWHLQWNGIKTKFAHTGAPPLPNPLALSKGETKSRSIFLYVLS